MEDEPTIGRSIGRDFLRSLQNSRHAYVEVPVVKLWVMSSLCIYSTRNFNIRY
jgi:hypothetical protein